MYVTSDQKFIQCTETIQYNSPAKFGNILNKEKILKHVMRTSARSITNLLKLHDNGLSKQKNI